MKQSYIVLLVILFINNDALGQDRWEAPAEADTLENPYIQIESEVITEGEELYLSWCSSCHGDRGNGSGEAGQAWNPPPADFTSEQVQRQSDGALFWKVWEGNQANNMLSYKNMLSREEVWQLVVYLRQFKTEE